MPDIPDRDEKEKIAARLIGRLQKAQMTEILKKLGNPPKIENIPLEAWDELGADFLAEAAPLLSKFFLAAAEEMIRNLPYGVDWALVNERAANYATRYGGELVKNVLDTTRRSVGESVARYYERGQTMGDLEANLALLRDELGNLLGPTRAEMIAVTEVTRASARGEDAIAAELREQGIEMTPVWNTNYDELVCDICEPLNQQPAAGRDADGIPYWEHPEFGNVSVPGHPRCRCWESHELVLENA